MNHISGVVNTTGNRTFPPFPVRAGLSRTPVAPGRSEEVRAREIKVSSDKPVMSLQIDLTLIRFMEIRIMTGQLRMPKYGYINNNIILINLIKKHCHG